MPNNTRVDLLKYLQEVNGESSRKGDKTIDTITDAGAILAQGALQTGEGIIKSKAIGDAFIPSVRTATEQYGVDNLFDYIMKLPYMVGQRIKSNDDGMIADRNYQQDKENMMNVLSDEYISDRLAQYRTNLNTAIAQGGVLESALMGIGQMLPSVLMGGVAGAVGGGVGYGLSALASYGNLAAMGVSSFGSGTQKALNDGGSLNKSALYGLGTATAETASEFIGGESIGGVVAPYLQSGAGRSTAGALKGVLRSGVEEGIEEVMTDAVEPFLDMIYKGKDAVKKDFSVSDMLKQMGTDFAGAALSSAVLGAFSAGTNKELGIQDALEKNANNIEELRNTRDFQKRQQIISDINYNMDKVESALSTMSEKQRSAFVSEINENGNYMTDGGRFTDAMRRTFALGDSTMNMEARTVSSFGREEQIRKDLSKELHDSVKDENGNYVNSFKLEVAKELTDTQKQGLADAEAYLNDKYSRTGADIALVAVESGNGRFEGTYKNDIVYMDRRTLDSPKDYRRVLDHELAHVTEGTLRGAALKQGIKSMEGYSGERADIGRRYGYDEETIRKVNDHDNGLTVVEQADEIERATRHLDSETYAHTMEVLSDERLWKDATSKGVLQKIGSAIDRIREFAKGDRSYRQLKNIEARFDEALAEKGWTWRNGKIVGSAGDDDDTNLSLETWRKNVVLVGKDADGNKIFESGKTILQRSMEKIGWSKKEIDNLVSQVESVADVVEMLSKDYKVLQKFSEIKPYYTPNGDLMLSCVISNGEYDLNIDFSTICRKRESLSKFLTEYTESGHDFGKRGFDKANQAYLENLLKKYGLDTACTFCFVESRRKNVDNWSKKFERLWNEALKSSGLDSRITQELSDIEDLKNIDVIDGITDEIAFDVANQIEGEALAAIEAEQEYNSYMAGRRGKNPNARPNTQERMREYMAKNVSTGKVYRLKANDLLNTRVITYIKAVMPDMYSILLTSYGANAPKQTLPAAPYASQVFLDKDFAGDDMAKHSFEMGGFRSNSFSDFQITRVLDYIQMVADATARKAAIQTYLKELAMVELLGKSGLKMNMSLIPEVDTNVDRDHAGLDKDGNYIFSSDSADARKAFELQETEGMKGNVGTILVGISKYQILKALDDPRIKMIIPYHPSGMPKHLKIFFNHLRYTSYESFQNTMKTNMTKVANDPFMKVFYDSYQANGGNYLKATQDYLDYCKENGLVPRFAMKWDASKSFEENLKLEENYIVSHPNYYKVLIDFTSDGGVDANGKQIFVQQRAVTLNLDGIDVRGIVEREAKRLESDISKYEDNKFAMFKEFQDAVNGTVTIEEEKAKRDERIARENKENTYFSVTESPVLYEGSKRRIISEINQHIPEVKGTFYDLFGGSGTVSYNAKAQKVVYNDGNAQVARMVEAFSKTPTDRILSHVFGQVNRYEVNTPDGFVRFREMYNSTPMAERNPLDLYTLIEFSYGTSAKWTNDGNYSKSFMTGGRPNLANLRKELKSRLDGVKGVSKGITYGSGDALKMMDKATKGDYVYLDPPYSETDAGYNRQWTKAQDRAMMEKLDELDSKGVSWGMSNQFLSKGKEINSDIRKWAESNGYAIYEIPNGTRPEVFITNTPYGTTQMELDLDMTAEETNKFSISDLEPQKQQLFIDKTHVREYIGSNNIIELHDGDSVNTDRPKVRAGRVVRQGVGTLTTHGGNYAYVRNGELYKFTPRDFYRLMGFSDKQYQKASSVNKATALYMQAGNSIAVPVLEAMVKNMDLPKKVRLEEHFAGIGAIRTALERQGYEIESTGVVEFNPNSVKSYNALYGTNEKPTDVIEYVKDVEPHEIDLALFGSPCVDNSSANSKGVRGYERGSNTKSEVFWDSFDYLMKCKPTIVVWENVENVIKLEKLKSTFDEVIRIMKNNGYNVSFDVLDARDFGIPQSRRRIFVVATLNDKFVFPKGDRTNTPTLLEYLDNKDDSNFSLSEDSQGKKLSDGQRKFFKDTKAVDKNGRLLRLYHGTKTGGFEEFYLHKHTGYFFTDNFNNAMTYSGSRDIYNPSRFDTWEDAIKWFNSNNEEVYPLNGLEMYEEDGTYYVGNEYGRDAFEEDEIDEFIDYIYHLLNDNNGFSTNYSVYLDMKEPLEIDANRSEWNNIEWNGERYDTNELAEYAKDAGYDGLIIRNVYDSGPYSSPTDSDVFVVFKPNQIKDTYNFNPTKESNFIQFSVKPEGDYMISRVWSYNGAERAIKKILSKYDISIGKMGQQVMADSLHKAMELDAKNGYTDKIYNDIADEIFQAGYYRDENGIYQRGVPDTDIETFRSEIVSKLKKAVESRKTNDYFKDIVNEYHDKVVEISEKAKADREMFKAKLTIKNLVDNIKFKMDHQNTDGTRYEAAIEEFSKNLRKCVTRNGNIVAGRARELMRQYVNVPQGGQFPLMYEMFGIENVGDYVEFREMANDIALGTHAELTLDETKEFMMVLQNYYHNVVNYNSVFFEGRRQNEQKLVDRGTEEQQERGREYHKERKIRNFMRGFLDYVTNPIRVFESISGFDRKSVVFRFYRELEIATNKQARFLRKTDALIEDFTRKNEKYISTWWEPSCTVEVGGTTVRMSKGQLITLWMTAQRDQGQSHLFGTNGNRGKMMIVDDALAKKGKYRESLNTARLVPNVDASMMDSIERQLNEKDREFIAMAQEFFNSDEYCRGTFNDVMNDIYGVSTGVDDNYIPIVVSDDEFYQEKGNRSISSAYNAYRPSYSMKTVQNAHKTIVIDNILLKLQKHQSEMAAFVMTPAMKTINRIYNRKDSSGISLRMIIKSQEPGFDSYLGQYLSDIQGNFGQKSQLERIGDSFRKVSITATLGLNVKTWFSQVASLPNAHAYGLSYKSIIRGLARAVTAFKQSNDEMMAGSDLAYDRYREGFNQEMNDLLQSGRASLTMRKFVEGTMKPLTAFDRMAIVTIWNACKIEKGNMGEAVELFERTVIGTQPYYGSVNRSAIMREQRLGGVVKTETMYMTMPLQNLTLLVQGVEEAVVIGRLYKSKKVSEARYREALKNLHLKASSVMFESALMALIGALFTAFKNAGKPKEDDDKTFVQDFLTQFGASYISMIPIVKDFYELAQGYELSDMYYTGLTNVYNGVRNSYSLLENAFTKKNVTSQEWASSIRKTTLGLSQLFGIPLSNVEKYTKGMVGLVSPGTRVSYENMFGKYPVSKLAETMVDAEKKGNTRYAETLAGLITSDKGAGSSGVVSSELARLAGSGYDVMPKSIPTEVDGEKVTKAQAKAFASVYEKATQDIEKMLSYKSYDELDDQAKAKAIQAAYNIYYAQGLARITGSETKDSMMAKALDVQKMALAKAYYGSLGGEKKAKVVRYVQGTKMTAAQKYMLLGYLGYSNANGEAQVKALIRGLGLSAEDQKRLLGYSGY